MTATEAEIRAAAQAIRDVEDPMEAVFEFMPAARAALEAAERVRANANQTGGASDRS